MQQSVKVLAGYDMQRWIFADNRRVAAVFFAVLVVAGVCAAFAPFYVVAVVAGGLAFVCCCNEKRLKYVLFALAAYAPFEAFALKWVPQHLYMYARFGHYAFLAACFVPVMLRRLVEGRRLWIRTPIDIPLMLFLVVSAASIAVNGVPLLAAGFSYQPLLRFIFLAFFLVQFIEFDEKDARRLTVLMLCVVFVEALVCIGQSAIGYRASMFLAPTGGSFMGHTAGGMTQPIYHGHYHVFGTLGRYNVLGAFMALFFLLSLPMYSRAGENRVHLYVLHGVMLMTIVLAAARAPWLSLVVALWVVAVIKKQAKAVVIPLIIGLGLLSALTVFATSASYFGIRETTSLGRLLEPFSADYIEVAMRSPGRLFFIVRFPFNVLTQDFGHFFLGYGPGSLGLRAVEIFDMTPLTKVGVAAHEQNYIVDVNWSYIFGQVGIVGLAVFAGLCFNLFKTIVRISRTAKSPYLRDLALGMVGVSVLMFVCAVFNIIWEQRALSLYFWLYAGIILKLARDESAENNGNQIDIRK